MNQGSKYPLIYIALFVYREILYASVGYSWNISRYLNFYKFNQNPHKNRYSTEYFHFHVKKRPVKCSFNDSILKKQNSHRHFFSALVMMMDTLL